MDLSMQRPEGALISSALRASPGRTSAAAAAAQAGIGVTRWRDIISGSRRDGSGERVPVTAPARTLARICEALGITPEELAAAGRPDAAGAMREEQHARLTPTPPPTPAQRAVMSALTSSGVSEPEEQLEILACLVSDLASRVRVLRY